MLSIMEEKTFTSVELNDFKNEIKTKWGYDEDYSENIALTAEDIIEYFGVEYKDIILAAIKSCKFITLDSSKKGIPNYKKDVIDFVSKNYPTCYQMSKEKIEKSISERGSLYLSIPQIESKTGKIKGVEHIILLPSKFNYDSDFYRGILIREVIKLIKSYQNNYFLDDDILYERNGISLAKYDYKREKTSEPKLINTRGLGIENGLSIYDELCIMRKINDILVYDIAAMQNLRIISSYMFESLSNMKNRLIEMQFNGDINSITNLLDSNPELVSLVDELLKLEEQRLTTLSDEKNNVILTEINNLFKKASPFIRKFNKTISMEKRDVKKI